MKVYLVWFMEEMIGVFETIEKARECVQRRADGEYDSSYYDIVPEEVR